MPYLVPGESDLWLEIEVEIEPEKNTQWAAQLPVFRILAMVLRLRLSGLYFSGSMYCTQMEAEGAELMAQVSTTHKILKKRSSRQQDAHKCLHVGKLPFPFLWWPPLRCPVQNLFDPMRPVVSFRSC